MTRVRVGVTGAGSSASRHLRRLLKRADVCVVGVADPDPLRRRQVASDFGVPTFESDVALFERARPEAVFICLPPDQHGSAEELALEARAAMFIEKPLAADLASAERLLERIDGVVPVAVGYQWRQLSFLPRLQARLADDGANLVVGSWLSRPASTAWWGDVTRAGGQIVEQMTHLVDLALQLNGPVTSIVGAGSPQRLRDSPTGFHKASAVLVRFAGGAIGTFAATCALSAPHRMSLELFGDELAAAIGEHEAQVVDRGSPETWQHDGPDLYERQLAAFLELIRDGRTSRPLASYREALASHAVACAMEDALADPALTEAS